MKSIYRKSAIALAVATLVPAGVAVAQGVESTTTNLVDVEMNKSLSLSKQITITGGIEVQGTLPPDSAAVAVIDNKQFNSGNTGVTNNGPIQNLNLSNTASSSDDMLNGATGNIAVNMNAGDNNMQDNASANAAADDSTFVFGLVDSEVYVHQEANNNTTHNQSVSNNATIGQSSFKTSAGNIGVNFAAGNSNLQKNNFSSAVASAGVAEASVNTQQHSTANVTSNSGEYIPVVDGGAVSGHFESAQVVLATPEGQPLTGFGQGNMSGTYGSDAIPLEENGSFLVNGTPSPANLYSSSHAGGIGANENSTYELGAVFTGNVEYYVIDQCASCAGIGGTTFATNTVRLDNQAFMGAGGNIGANLASGSGNLQSNSLSMSITPQ